MCLALCLVLGVQRWKHVAVTPWWLQLSLREESQYILHNQNQRLLINESVLVWRTVCSLQSVFCLAFLSMFWCKDGKYFIKSASPQSTRDSEYNGWQSENPKKFWTHGSTEPHTKNCLPFPKKECEVQVQSRKAWDYSLAPSTWRMWPGHKVPSRLTATECRPWAALPLPAQ